MRREQPASLVHAADLHLTAEDVATRAEAAGDLTVRDAVDAPRIVGVPFVTSPGSPTLGGRTTRRSNDAGIAGTYTQQFSEDSKDDQ